jgi:hypothetical protein
MGPLLLAYGFAVVLGQTGFVLHAPDHPTIAKLLRRTLPAPPSSLGAVALHLMPLVRVLGAYLVLAALAYGVRALGAHAARRLRDDWPARLRERVSPVARWLCVGLAAACWAPASFAYESPIPFFAAPVPQPLFTFSQQVREIAGDHTVLARWPGQFVSFGGMRTLQWGAPEHTNHYVHERRQRAVADAFASLAAGDFDTANSLLDRYDVAYLLEMPHDWGVFVRFCGGRSVLELPPFRLIERVRCGPRT